MGDLFDDPKKVYFRLHVKALKIIGVSINGYDNVAYRIYSIVIVGALIVMYPILDFFELFKHESDVVFDILLYSSSGLCAATKTFVLITNRVKLGNVLSKLQEKPFLPDLSRGGESEETLMRECFWITTVQTCVYWFLGFTTVSVTIMFSLIKTIRNNNYGEFPYGPFTPLNVTNSFYYEVCWAYQCSSIAAIASAFIMADALITAVLIYLSYQFRLLQNFIKQILKVGYENMTKWNDTLDDSEKDVDPSIIPWERLHEALEAAVTYHTKILDIACEMESTFSTLLLVTFLEALIMICLSEYHASMVVNDMKLIRYLGEMVGSALQVALFCYWGEKVTEESRKVGLAAYESNFVGTDVRFQKALALIIRRSQTPTVVTAGKFADIELSTFSWVLRTSYSTFMVLRRANINKQKQIG